MSLLAMHQAWVSVQPGAFFKKKKKKLNEIKISLHSEWNNFLLHVGSACLISKAA